jgi:hypothetical protein
MEEISFSKNSWSYIKRGKSEMWFLLSIYNTILLYSTRYNISISMIIIAVLSFVILSYVVGYYLIKRVDIVNPKIIPFTQDNIQSAYFLNEGLICLSGGDNESARKFFIRSRSLRKRWINDESFNVDDGK